MIDQQQVDASRVIDIIREENPMVLELAMRRALIEQQRDIIERLELTQERTNGSSIG